MSKKKTSAGTESTRAVVGLSARCYSSEKTQQTPVAKGPRSSINTRGKGMSSPALQNLLVAVFLLLSGPVSPQLLDPSIALMKKIRGDRA